MYAVTEEHGPKTLEALCLRGAFFAETEYTEGVIAMMHLPVLSMEAVLHGLSNRGFIQGCFGFVNPAAPNVNDRGTALHICCSLVPIDRLYETMTSLLEFGVSPGIVTKKGGLRASDILAMRASGLMQGSCDHARLMVCVRHLSRIGAAPVRHIAREIRKIEGLPNEVADKIICDSFNRGLNAEEQQQLQQ